MNVNTSSALRVVLGFVVLFSLVSVAYSGGWDLVTVKDFPEFAVAGKPLNLTFTVWVPSLESPTGLHSCRPCDQCKRPSGQSHREGRCRDRRIYGLIDIA
jgi:hypothetical protein